MAVSVRYKGYYQNAEKELAPHEHWQRKFRAGDNLFLVGNFEGQEVGKQVPLWDNVADLYSPGRPAQGEILLMRVSTNAEGKVARYTRVLSNSVAMEGEKGGPEFNVFWGLMRP